MTNPQKAYSVERFGTEQAPVVIIDNFVSDPDNLKSKAQGLRFEKDGPYYPGLRAPADPAYLQEAVPLLSRILETEFKVARGTDLLGCTYSLVTTPPQDLSPKQRIPHFDGTDENIIAVLHFLCDETNGGTAFFRHNETGFESMTSRRLPDYNHSLERYAHYNGLPPARYFTGDTEQYKQIGTVNARYNRCIIYRGNSLHSGRIPKDLPLSASPATGRLTINSFLVET